MNVSLQHSSLDFHALATCHGLQCFLTRAIVKGHSLKKWVPFQNSCLHLTPPDLLFFSLMLIAAALLLTCFHVFCSLACSLAQVATSAVATLLQLGWGGNFQSSGTCVLAPIRQNQKNNACAQSSHHSGCFVLL